MKRAILTVGPQYAGKSTFCEKVIAVHPETVLASRDKILARLYGTVWLDTYSGGHYVAWEELWREISEHSLRSDLTLIVDAWNLFYGDRRQIVERLKGLGFSRVDAWLFVTPLATCIEWGFIREPLEENSPIAEIQWAMRIESTTRMHKNFLVMSLENELLFDSIRRIDAREPVSNNILDFPL